MGDIAIRWITPAGDEMSSPRLIGPYLSHEEKALVEQAVRDIVHDVKGAYVGYAIIARGGITVEGLPWWKWLARRRATRRIRAVLRAIGPRGCVWTVGWVS